LEAFEAEIMLARGLLRIPKKEDEVRILVCLEGERSEQGGLERGK